MFEQIHEKVAKEKLDFVLVVLVDLTLHVVDEEVVDVGEDVKVFILYGHVRRPRGDFFPRFLFLFVAFVEERLDLVQERL